MEYLSSKLRASDIVLGCPFSLKCLTENNSLPETFCENYEDCPGLSLCKRIEKKSPAFWKLILNIFNAIKPTYLNTRLFIVGIDKGLEIEKKNFLSLLFLYFSKKDFKTFNLISQEHIEAVVEKMKSFKEIFQEISDENPKLLEIVLDNFSDLLLSDFFQKGILSLLDIFCEAEKESKKPILQSSDALFRSIDLFLRGRF